MRLSGSASYCSQSRRVASTPRVLKNGGSRLRLLDPDHGLVPWFFLSSSRDFSIRAIVLACSNDSPVGIGPSFGLDFFQLFLFGLGQPDLVSNSLRRIRSFSMSGGRAVSRPNSSLVRI